VRIHNNLIYRTGIGVAVTEFATAALAHNTIVACGTGLQLTEKTAGEGGGHASAWNQVLWDNERAVTLDQTSTLNLTCSVVEGGWSGAGEGIVPSDPRFRDPLLRDYRLAWDSPALATGLGGADMGALWPVGGIPAAPEDLQVVALGPSSLLLRWTDRSLDETGFRLEQSTVEGVWEMADRIGPNQQVYLDQPTEAGLVYRYRVRSEGRWGMSFPSDAVVAGLATDRDQDGMNDDWELRHGLDPDSDHDAGLDPDGDGQSNALEFQSGTDPNNRDSVLKLSVTRTTSYSVGFGFRAEAGRAYVVEYTSAVSAGEWISGLELPPPPAAEWVEIEIPLTAGAEGYYRVRLGSAR
jgi:hypothetical protein